MIAEAIVVEIPITISIPGDYADWATYETALPYLVPNDRLYLRGVAAQGTVTLDAEDDGTLGNEIVIYFRGEGTLDLASNDYITVYHHPNATISNSAGTGITLIPFNGAAGL